MDCGGAVTAVVMGTVAVVENPPPVSGCGGGLGSPADANVGGLTVRVVVFVMQLEDGKRVDPASASSPKSIMWAPGGNVVLVFALFHLRIHSFKFSPLPRFEGRSPQMKEH